MQRALGTDTVNGITIKNTPMTLKKEENIIEFFSLRLD